MGKLLSGTLAGVLSKTKWVAAAAFASALLLPGTAVAAPIVGSFNGTGWATVSFTNLNFCPNGQEPNGANAGNACGSGVGNVDLGGGSGAFLGVNGDLHTIDSLNSGIAPVGVNVNIPGWLEFNPAQGAPPISLTLIQVQPGTFSAAQCAAAPAAGQTCTPPGSAFNLSNQSATSSIASFQVIGNAVNGQAGDTQPFVAVFSSQFNVPYQALLAALATNNNTGTYSSSYSVSVTAVPEPMTLSLVGVALIGLGLTQRRRVRK